jgi:hypothetical protein
MFETVLIAVPSLSGDGRADAARDHGSQLHRRSFNPVVELGICPTLRRGEEGPKLVVDNQRVPGASPVAARITGFAMYTIRRTQPDSLHMQRTRSQMAARYRDEVGTDWFSHHAPGKQCVRPLRQYCTAFRRAGNPSQSDATE